MTSMTRDGIAQNSIWNSFEIWKTKLKYEEFKPWKATHEYNLKSELIYYL